MAERARDGPTSGGAAGMEHHHHHPHDNEEQPPPSSDDSTAAGYEQTHVHAVYETIAPHFSATRHSPWPLVTAFLSSQPPGSLGYDIGCGNGKYLCAIPAPDGVAIIGCDRSAALVALARGRSGGEVLVADGLALPFRSGSGDFAICIAVVHHLSTRERRVEGIGEVLRVVREKGGRVLVYVWALEQAGSRRGWKEGGEQDLLVPWVVKGSGGKTKKRRKEGGELGDGGEEEAVDPDQTYQRYYHLYRKGELEEDVLAAGGKVISSGYERDNWWVIASPGSSSSSSNNNSPPS